MTTGIEAPSASSTPVYLERWLVEQLMFGSGRVRRFTQDTPVLPDVWLEYALDAKDFPNRLTQRDGDDPHARLAARRADSASEYMTMRVKRPSR